MKQEIKETKSTRVGPYVWDIDIDTMGVEELMALKMLCEDKLKEQLCKEYRNRIIVAIKNALDDGINFSFEIDGKAFVLTDIINKLHPVDWA